MRVLLLGGSNAGVYFGWAAQLQGLMPEHEITNMFLGAVGSLYGLARLQEAERREQAPPDLVVFEYALNDIILLDAGFATAALVHDALSSVAQHCAERGVPLLFLCLRPRPTGRARVSSQVRRIERIYRGVARARAMARCVTLEAILGRERAEDFVDAHHLTAEASRRCAEVVAKIISSGEIPVPRVDRSHTPIFDYVPAAAARAQGRCRNVDIVSTVFSGAFLEIARPGSSHWPGRGRLAGLLLRSTHESGVFRIAAGGRAYARTAQSSMREIVPNLILLHYSRRRPWADFDLEVAMPDDASALAALPEEKTLLPAEPGTPFAEQTLQIAGVMFWRPSFWRRWLAFLRLRLGS
ncbi:SGNH/GDSL hydrolase family protein [Methylosinus sp. H3A]|uniref:SGNH/GDSL hydrolase family protein n=1 Tax=Methylosinus sp. H3A TaxID=2785786 RepID=UPI0018C22DCD|nr:SGNH/GDSL hydrolase family protein [Methylosinus sp. H3A]MBG0809468.1 SGNH/GDSL hydrolase family protein [Methylosinus sp. H3A]